MLMGIIQMKPMHKALLLAVFCWLSSSSLYCSSSCGDNDTLCLAISYKNCTGCALNFYSGSPNISLADPCIVLSGNKIVAKQLLTDNMSLVGYSSSQSTFLTCSAYSMSGKYVLGDYLAKTYTAIGVNHYNAIVRFTIGFMGTWTTESLLLKISDSNGVQTPFGPMTKTCSHVQMLCLSINDCFNTFQTPLISHNTDSLTVNFTSISMQTNSLIQFWGVKDLLIAVQMCDSSCQTCSGSSSNNCSSCVGGLYLLGSVCIIRCPLYTLPNLSMCTNSCPIYYFLNAVNSYCELCPSGCSICTNVQNCLQWDATANPQNLLYDKIEVWIILAFFLIFLIGLLFWKCCLARKTFISSMEEDVINHTAPDHQIINASNDDFGPHWIQQIDDLSPVKVSVKKNNISKQQIEGFGKNIIKK